MRATVLPGFTHYTPGSSRLATFQTARAAARIRRRRPYHFFTPVSDTIILRDFAGVPEITPSAYQLRNDALNAAHPVRQVTNDDEQAQAVAALRLLKDLRSG